MSQATPSINLGTLQSTLQAARKDHSTNSKALAKAQEAAKRSKLALENATAALEEAARNVLANG
jgi:hypothetical protein